MTNAFEEFKRWLEVEISEVYDHGKATHRAMREAFEAGFDRGWDICAGRHDGQETHDKA
jgi:hypothetical protein